MFRFLSWCLKIIPSVYYVIELNLFIRDTLIDIPKFWKNVFAYGVPSIILIGGLLYLTFFRDLYERQKAREQFENEEKAWTIKTQTLRMFRVYIPLGVIGALIGALAYFYKPYIILLSIKVGILYAWFLLGEVFRIIWVGQRNNKEIVKKLKENEK